MDRVGGRLRAAGEPLVVGVEVTKLGRAIGFCNVGDGGRAAACLLRAPHPRQAWLSTEGGERLVVGHHIKHLPMGAAWSMAARVGGIPLLQRLHRIMRPPGGAGEPDDGMGSAGSLEEWIQLSATQGGGLGFTVGAQHTNPVRWPRCGGGVRG